MAVRGKIILALIVPVVVGLLPGLVLNWLGLGSISGDATIAIMAGLMAGLYNGERIGLLLSGWVAVAAGLAVVASSQPILAALLMAATGLSMGVAAKGGRHSYVVMGPITVAFVLAEPPSAASWWTVGLVLGVCSVYGAVLGGLAGRRMKRPTLESLGTPRALAYGLILALLLAVGGWVVVQRDLGHAGAWMLMTMMIVVQPYLQDGWTRSLQRALGTVAGFVVAVLIGVLMPYAWLLYTISAVAFVMGFRDRFGGKAYWQFVAWLTLGIVLVEGASTSVVDTAEQRLFATLAGAGAALLAMAIMGPIYRSRALASGIEHY